MPVIIIALLCLASYISTAGNIEVTDLRCEYLVNLLCIDLLKPRLIWKLESELREREHTAYHLFVAGSSDMDRYIEKKSLPQIEELVKNYVLDLIWFDTPAGMTYERSEKFRDMARKYRPDCIINSRTIYNGRDKIEQKKLVAGTYYVYV